MINEEKEQSRSAEETKLLGKIAAIVDERKQRKEQAAEYGKEAERLRAKARKLIKEAKEKERQQEELQETNNTDHRLRRLRCKLLLCRLKRNDPTAVFVDARMFPQGQGGDLSMALHHNTTVTTLDLDITQFLPTLRTLPSNGEPLFQFLSHNPSLVNLRVTRGPFFWGISPYTRTVLDAILKAMSESKCIEKLSWDLPVSPQIFHDLMKNSTTLRELNIDFAPRYRSYSNDDCELITSGFTAEHAKLESLKLHLRDSAHLVIGILENLQHVPSMKKLTLVGRGHRHDDESYTNIFEAAAVYLQSTCTLQRLELDGFYLTDALMRVLLDGLTHSGGDTGTSVPSVFVEQLAFPRCDVTEEAIEHLVTFLQTKTTSPEGHVTYQSCLRELTVKLSVDDDMAVEAYNEQFAASFLMQSCSERSGLLLPTVGSQICTLRMDNDDSLFLEYLAENAALVRLRNLQLYGVEDDAAEVLPKILPKLTSIQELTVNDIESRFAARCIVKALKHSSSILSVSTAGGQNDPSTTGGWNRPLAPCTDFDEEYDCGFSSTELRLIKAYCDRNRFFGDLFKNEESEEYMQDTESMTDATTLVSSEPVEVDAIQYPSLFKVAMQVPVKLSRSLQKFGGQVGPDPAQREQCPGVRRSDAAVSKNKKGPSSRIGGSPKRKRTRAAR